MKTIIAWWNAERGRRFLWLPASFAAGIAVYFALPFEPDLWALVALMAVATLTAVACWRWVALRPALWLLIMMVAGVCWSAVNTRSQSMVVIDQAYEPQRVTGTISDMQRTAEGFRITLDEVLIEHLSAEETPSRIRLSVRPKRGEFAPVPPIGSRVTLLAGLLPPMTPGLPGGFDFRRYFYFNHIGAIGYGLPPVQEVPPPLRGERLGGGRNEAAPLPDNGPLPTSPLQGEEKAGAFTRLQQDFWQWRVALSDRIIQQLGPRTGPVAAGLITGDARAISDADFELWRASNLYHIIAISGEHMVVISGVIFFILRALTLCLPARWRYRPEMKSYAAVVTLALVSVYIFVTGLPVSAVRAYLMIALVLAAIILRRRVNPMRSLFIAGLLMLIYAPADLFDPGFQLSFSATIAIIALVESARLHVSAVEGTPLWRRGLRLFITMIFISVVAELATTPFVLSQFNTISAYGIIANMAATPLVSFFLMPLVALFFLLLPLGLSNVALTLMDWGIRALYAIAETVSHWPHALWAFPSPPGWAVAAFALGLLWLCIWQKRPRYLALPIMLVALISPLFVRVPDMMIGAELKQIAFRGPQGYVLARGKAASLLPKLWANGLGYTGYTEDGKDDVWQCDPLGCVATVGARHVAFPADALALADDCARADVVVSRLDDVECAGKIVIDGGALEDGGVHALWFESQGVRVEASAQWQHQRPWNQGYGNDEED